MSRLTRLSAALYGTALFPHPRTAFPIQFCPSVHPREWWFCGQISHRSPSTRPDVIAVCRMHFPGSSRSTSLPVLWFSLVAMLQVQALLVFDMSVNHPLKGWMKEPMWPTVSQLRCWFLHHRLMLKSSLRHPLELRSWSRSSATNLTGRAPSDKTKTTFKWESQLLMDVLTLSTPDRPTAKQSLVLACTNVSCRGFELLLPTGLASPKWPCHFRALWLQGINTRYHPLQAPWAIMPGDI